MELSCKHNVRNFQHQNAASCKICEKQMSDIPKDVLGGVFDLVHCWQRWTLCVPPLRGTELQSSDGIMESLALNQIKNEVEWKRLSSEYSCWWSRTHANLMNSERNKNRTSWNSTNPYIIDFTAGLKIFIPSLPSWIDRNSFFGKLKPQCFRYHQR